MQHHVVAQPFTLEEQGRLNDVLRGIRKKKPTEVDSEILQQMYGFEQKVVEQLDPEDASPMGPLLAKANKAWNEHMVAVSQQLAAPAPAAH